jgi:glycosyltransferase involved in cell wall biosynthesis
LILFDWQRRIFSAGHAASIGIIGIHLVRVLYFSPRECWPVITGAHLRDFHLARELAIQSKLTYLGFTSLEGMPPEGPGRARCEPLGNSETILLRRKSGYAAMDLVRGCIGPQPISVLNYKTGPMIAQLEALLREQEFDVIQVEGVHLLAYIEQIRKAAPRAVLIGDWHNIESELMARYAENTPSLFRRLYAARTTGLLRMAEDRLLALCDAHTVCSGRERDLLLARAPRARVEVIGNGVDVKFFTGEAGGGQAERRNLVFVGSMGYHANIDAALYFAREIWPQVLRLRPDLRFLVVGSRPAPEVLELAKQPGITVTGTVEDIRPYYRQALAVVVPLRVGSGTRLKVLEAMASGVPVLSTTLGAEGLDVTPDKNILISDSAAGMVRMAAEIRSDSREWNELAANGRKLVESAYDWGIFGAKLRKLYTELLAARR